MTAEVCPYCRDHISDKEAITACAGCGTRHHADCYTENGGCTIFGCSCAPAEEPKLSVSAPELVTVTTTVAVTAPALPAVAPPPPPGSQLSSSGSSVATSSTVEELQQISNRVVPSMFGAFTETPDVPDPAPAPGPPKSRTTFIVLGALLGAFGAHNFYAGYRNKAIAQFCITAFTLGFAGPMSWIWAIIDICTVDRDSKNVEFSS